MFVLVGFIVLILPAAMPGAENCTHKNWKWKVDRKAALELQQFVNDGHEPWRMDVTGTVAEQAIEARKKIGRTTTRYWVPQS